MRAVMIIVAVMVIVVLSGCPRDLDQFQVVDAMHDAADAGVDAEPADGAVLDAATADAGVLDALDPALSLPDPGGDPCDVPGAQFECPFLEVCRISSPTGGTCEGCNPCRDLNLPCGASHECEIPFQCYQGRCTDICRLGSGECGPLGTCLEVGNETYGVCQPG